MCDAHERLELSHWWFVGRRRVIERVLSTQLTDRPQRRLLDVGSGTGGMLPLLSKFGVVTGSEFNEEARARARRRFPEVEVLPCRLPDELPSGQWHVVTSFDVIEHAPGPVESLRIMRDRLTRDGQMVLTVPAFEFLWSHHDDANQHFRRYSLQQLERDLTAAGLTVTFASYFNALLFPAIASVRLMQRALPWLGERGGSGDLEAVWGPLNASLSALLALEARALPRLRWPAGVSLIVVARPV